MRVKLIQSTFILLKYEVNVAFYCIPLSWSPDTTALGSPDITNVEHNSRDEIKSCRDPRWRTPAPFGFLMSSYYSYGLVITPTYVPQMGHHLGLGDMTIETELWSDLWNNLLCWWDCHQDLVVFKFNKAVYAEYRHASTNVFTEVNRKCMWQRRIIQWVDLLKRVYLNSFANLAYRVE